MSTRAVIRKSGEGERVNLAGQPLVFLVTGENTKHTSMFDWTVAPGFSTGLHVHAVQEETFYVVEGECEWQIGEERVKAGRGTYVFIPPGVAHSIDNVSGRPARLLMTVSPPGHEHYFEELAKLVGTASPPDPSCIAELRSRYDTRQLSALKK
jgi:quercetin dioxygenase-like cupin family protein